ncbi:MAG: hypothetical protein AB7V10_00715 [Leucobacter sp.]|jgi:hypothetical protein
MTILATTILGVALAAEDTEFDPASVTPGVVGFVVTAVFALAVILLGTDLVRRVRRSQYRAEIAEELQAELAERDGAGAQDGAGSQDVAGSGDGGDISGGTGNGDGSDTER